MIARYVHGWVAALAIAFASSVANAQSAPISILIAPTSAQTFTAPATVTMSALAFGNGASIARVEFYANGVLRGTDTSYPYEYPWTNVAAGSYSLTAKAYDTRGLATVSSPVSIVVRPGITPPVSILSPANNTTYTAPAIISLTASASGWGRPVARIEYFAGTTFIGTASSAPYAVTWSNVAAGTYALTAKAIDIGGASVTSASVTVIVNGSVNQPPSVNVTANPPAGSLIVSTTPLTFDLAAAVTDVDGSIARVRFLRRDPTSLPPTIRYIEFASVTQPPYTARYEANAPLDASYSFRVEAVDNGGLVGFASVNYTIVANRPPQTVLSEPGNAVESSGFTAPATIVLVVAAKELDLAPDRITRVDFLANGSPIGSSSTPVGTNGEFVFVWRDVVAGDYDVRVRAFDSYGSSTEARRTIKVIRAGNAPSIAITQPVSGRVYGDPVPLQVNLAPGDEPIIQVDYVNARGRLLASSTTAPYSANWVAPTPGRHAVTAVALQSNGVATTSPTVFFDVASPSVASPPLVVLTAPIAQTTISGDSPINVAADVLAAIGRTINSVDFFRNGVAIGTATTPPFRIAWSNAPSGSATLTARAFDSAAASTTSSPITVTINNSNPPPTVALTAPMS
ncbi:MAG TPA: Ig-like domain-containing protein, partial [Casimicrobiaceae bacterium]|nr:Ig-like domain-containing protein [Casimicrobiaceae bacterium]